MKILAIETSCDETAAAIVKDGTKILSSVTATSAGIHARTGGIIPEDAARKQVESIIPVINLALDEAKILIKDVDFLAVTFGPGLIGSLLVGVETTKTLAYIFQKPLISVNHLVGHLYANWLNRTIPPKFPAIGLVVSGGHTDLVFIKNHGKIKRIGGTRDDAAGEAFDKTARLLGFPYPGGPTLANAADEFVKHNKKIHLNMFPRPMITEENFDFSFSGLKTAVLNKIKEISGDSGAQLADYRKLSSNPHVEKKKKEIAAQTQQAIVDVIVEKSIRAIKKYQPKSFLLAGGVAANKALRNKLAEKINEEKLSTDLHIPDLEYCTDNATYIASCAYFNQNVHPIENIKSIPNLKITDN